MTYPCEIISDLLPLYKEGLASGATRAAVEAHLAACPACREELDSLADGGQPAAAALPLKRVSRGIKIRRYVAVLLAASLILSLVTALMAYLTDRKYLSYDPEQLKVSRVDDQLAFDIRDPRLNLQITGAPAMEQPQVMLYEVTLFYTNRLSDLTDRVRQQEAPPFQRVKVDDGKGWADFVPGTEPNRYTLDLEGIKENAVYYAKPGETAVLLYGKNLTPDGGYMTLPRLALVYYEWVMMAAALALGLALFIFFKKEKLRRALKALLGLPVCYLLGQVMVKGFSTLSYESLWRDIRWILACGAFLYAAWLLFWYQRRLNSLTR